MQTQVRSSRVNRSRCHRVSRMRRGAMLVLVGIMLIVFVVAAAFSIDVAYMQLVRTELRAATDAAAKAGVKTLSDSQDTEMAITSAVDYAGNNRVVGRPLAIEREDVELGQSTQQADGTWNFTPTTVKPNAVRVTARMAGDTPAGAVNLLLGKLLGTETFTPQMRATAAHYDHDIVLTIDRSHSMAFDHSGVEWVYPPNTPDTPHSIFYPPNPIGSRWSSLTEALDQFLDIVEQQYWQPRIGLVTWGSEVTLNDYDGNLVQRTEVAVATDAELGSTVQEIRDAIDVRSNDIMLGATHMSAGMDEAIAILTGQDARPFAKKTMILMTDGRWNRGRQPKVVAAEARDLGIVIHTITFLPTTDQAGMQEVASITGGRHFHAEDEAGLVEAFRELAMTLPIVLTE